MAKQVCMGAIMQCTFGNAPSSLVVLPTNKTYTNQQPDANILDHAPLINVQPFGMCVSLANPTVASATAAAMGALTPMPCIPNTPAPWAPGARTVVIGPAYALDDISKLTCVWGGIITFTSPGEVTVEEP